MSPFEGILEPVKLGTEGTVGEAVVEPAMLLAMLVYGIVALILRAIMMVTRPVGRAKADARVRQREASR